MHNNFQTHIIQRILTELNILAKVYREDDRKSIIIADLYYAVDTLLLQEEDV